MISSMHPAFHLRWMSQQMAQTKPSYVCYFSKAKGTFCEDLLGLTPLCHTRGEDIYEAIMQMLNERGIDVKNVVSITTNGAPAMIGKEKGAVQRLKEEHSDLLTYYCIIHQSVLCASLGEEYSDVMETFMKLVNYLRASSALQHHLLRAFLTEVRINSMFYLYCVLVWVGQWGFIKW